MAELTIALTYGNALFEAAGEVNKRTLILEEAAEVLGVLEQEPSLYAFMNSPVIPADKKKEALRAIFEGRICQELLNLLCIMVDKGRTRHYPKVVKIYKDLLNHEEGFAYGKIYSAVPLSPEQLSKFEEQTSKLLQENVKLENELDAGLIGGIKIFINGKVIDASIRKRLDDLADLII